MTKTAAIRVCTSVLALGAGLVVSATAPSGAAADSWVSADHRHAWSENTGWLVWRAPDSVQPGVLFRDTHLVGNIWGENIGWIDVGDGFPANGMSYSNTDGEEHGVNIDLNGDLLGWAWAENAGWIRFDTRDALGDIGLNARLDVAEGRLRGYAWGENIGWINLDDEDHFVSLECPADCFDADPCTEDECTEGDGCSNPVIPGCGGGGQCATNTDLNGDDNTTIADVQCSILTVLWALSGGIAPQPTCLAGSPETADFDCNASLDIVDIQLSISAVLGLELEASLDANGNGCLDSCEF